MLLRKHLAEYAIPFLERVFPEPLTFWLHLRQNLIIGLLVSGLVVLFQNSDIVRTNREMTIDWLINMQRGVSAAEGTQIRPFVFYDIDEKSHEIWREPLATPREKLGSLVQTALALRPAVLIVDVELARPTADDARLIEILKHHGQQIGAPTLILMQSFKWVEESAGNGHLLARPSFLHQALSPRANRIWASPLFERDHDGQFRRWKIWQSACNAAGTPTLVPSVQIAALAAIAGKSAGQALHETLRKATPDHCGEEAKPAGIRLQIAGHTIEASANAFAQRILFTLPWKLAEGERRPSIDLDGIATRLLTVFPAHAVTEGHLKPDVPPGHIAIIGASHQDARDNHFTPLGIMPGSMILINALASVIQYGQMTTPPALAQLLAATLMLVGVSFIFMKFPSLLGTIVSFIVLGALLIPLSVYFFRYGVWLDFALPLVAVKIFQVLTEYLRQYALQRKISMNRNETR